jgi:hypothetical protein
LEWNWSGHSLTGVGRSLQTDKKKDGDRAWLGPSGWMWTLLTAGQWWLAGGLLLLLVTIHPAVVSQWSRLPLWPFYSRNS